MTIFNQLDANNQPKRFFPIRSGSEFSDFGGFPQTQLQTYNTVLPTYRRYACILIDILKRNFFVRNIRITFK